MGIQFTIVMRHEGWFSFEFPVEMSILFIQQSLQFIRAQDIAEAVK